MVFLITRSSLYANGMPAETHYAIQNYKIGWNGDEFLTLNEIRDLHAALTDLLAADALAYLKEDGAPGEAAPGSKKGRKRRR